jgi:hypothetical protein
MQVDIMLFSMDQLQSLLHGSSVLTLKSVLMVFLMILTKDVDFMPKEYKEVHL